MRYIPHSYQETARRWIMDHPRCALFLDMGLGKTVVTLTAVQDLIDGLEVSRVLVVAPRKVAESTWTAEASKWDHLSRLRVAAVLGDEPRRVRALESDSDVYVIGRDSFVWLCGHYNMGKGRTAFALPFDMIVLDELTTFKSPKAQRFKAMRIAAAGVSRVVGLTGTPAPNGLADLWAQMCCVDGGERLGQSVGRYRDTYFHAIKWNNITIKLIPLKGAEEAIRNKISDICLSMAAADWIELPEMMEHTETVILSPDVMKAYNEFERDRVLEFRRLHESDGDNVTAANAAALMTKLSQFANGAVYDEEGQVHELHGEKIERLKELIEAAASPVLVFYQYRHDADRIEAAMKGLTVRRYEGTKDLDEWNAGKIDVLLAHPASTAYGLNMQQGGHYIVWFGTGWNLEQYLQANARLHRQGQTHPVIVYRLVCRDTVDERALAALERKDGTQRALLESLKQLTEKYR